MSSALFRDSSAAGGSSGGGATTGGAGAGGAGGGKPAIQLSDLQNILSNMNGT